MNAGARTISIEKTASSFQVMVDGKPLQTPLHKPLIVPNQKMAEAIAEEWRAQGKTIRRDRMPLTSIACVAIDLVREKRNAVVADVLSYATTDLLCYRTGDVLELYAMQTEVFDPLLYWAKQNFGVELIITNGIMPVMQDTDTKDKFSKALENFNEWELAALVSVIKPLSSIVLALAFVKRHINAETAFRISHLEEAFETAKWGEDEEKEARLARLKQEIAADETFLDLLSPMEN